MDKQGIGIGETFIFMLAAITFGAIIIFGYIEITKFQEKGEIIELVQFKTNLENDVKKIYPQFQAVRFRDYYPPVYFQQVCFVDLDIDPTLPENKQQYAELCKLDPYACDVWSEAWKNKELAAEGYSLELKNKWGYLAAGENVFLSPPSSGQVQIKVYHISLEDSSGNKVSYLCQSILGGKFSLMLEGMGTKTKIAPASKQSSQPGGENDS
ncbi:MAG TPA: hypothetical protein VJC39_03860 [Candidatus Nanoarchaeia archaeon]|nr:hypothetical protein [Candidatus Nanoarchaeia archaeon]